MLEWIHSLRQFLPDPALIILLGLGVFAVLELLVKAITHIRYRRSDNFVREQWRLSRHWDEYRALESQQLWHEKSRLPSLARLKELESLENQQEVFRQ